MKNILISSFVGICFLIGAAPGYTDNIDYNEYAGYKAKINEGLSIIAKSPKSLIDSVKEEYNAAEFKPFGVFGGILKGSFYSIGEFSRGVYHVITFNVDDDNFFSNIFNKEDGSE